jgi:menaquinone-dependent protoporphyrinogen IX oxidase
VKAVVIYESLTGNTKFAAGIIGDELAHAGIDVVVCPITNIDYKSLAEADLVIVGTWTDGLVLVGQRPGRAGRLRKLPVIDGKRCVVFITYAVDPGHTLEKLTRILEQRGAEVLGGMAIRRTHLEEGARDFVNRVLDHAPI